MTDLDQGWALGVDVGGTKIAAGAVSFADGTVQIRKTIPTESFRGGENVLARCVSLADDLLSEARSRLGTDPLGIGLGVPELLDLDGNVTSTFSVPWVGIPVVEAFNVLAPTRIAMDQNTAALAEARFGAGSGHDPFLYLTIGTGLGATLVQDGVPYIGARHAAGVFANGPFTVRCSHCGQLHRMVLDEISSGPALAVDYSDVTGRSVQGAEEVLEAAVGGDASAIEVVTEGGRALGVTLALMVDLLDPAVVVIGGGLGLAGGLYWDSMETAMREHIWSEPHRDLPVLPAWLGIDAGIIGAALMVTSP